MSTEKRLVIYTDGACSPNPGIGGYGVLFVTDLGDEFIGGGALQSTNNIMELTAVIRALECVDSDIPIDLHSDSTYVVNGFNEWLPGWLRRNWDQVKNVDLWKRAVALAKGRDLRLYHVRAHRENGTHHERQNCRVDRIAVRCRQDLARKV